MSYSKIGQTKKTSRTHRICSGCKKNRLIKFYEKPTSLKCDDCKRKAKKVKKQSSKGYIEAKQDTIWSKFVKDNAGNKCEYSGKTKSLNSHHIFSKSNKAVRHDVDNGVCLTSYHHVFSSKFSAHQTPAEFIEWIKKKRGLVWYEELRAKARRIR